MIRVLIAEHVHLLRMGLATYLAREPGITVVAERDRGDRVVTDGRGLRPNVAVIDVDLPPGGGPEAVARLRDVLPECAVVMLVGAGDTGGVHRALAVGPLGLISKEAPAELLTRCVRRVITGRRVVDPALAHAVRSVGENPLTPREAEVLRLAAGGATTAEIADRLSLSVKTVRNHLSRAIVRTEARNRMDAIRIASERRWL